MIKKIHFPHPDPDIDTFRIIEDLPPEHLIYSYSKNGVWSQMGFPTLDAVNLYIDEVKIGNKNPLDKT